MFDEKPAWITDTSKVGCNPSIKLLPFVGNHLLLIGSREF